MPELVAAHDVDKTYGEGDTATRALTSVTFSIDEGEFTSIVGQSGSGKSTLLNLLGLLDTPTQGRVMLRDQDTSQLERRQRAGLRGETIGFVFQFHHLLPEFSVTENMTMPLRIGGQKIGDEERERVDGLLDLLGLEGFQRRRDKDLSHSHEIELVRAACRRHL